MATAHLMSPRAELKLSQVLSAMSAALDLTEGQPVGHAARSCVIGMHIGEELRLDPDERSRELRARVAALEPAEHLLGADEDALDRVSEAFARIVDAKSPWTNSHSAGVARAAVGIGRRLGLPAGDVRDLRRAALLHDLGKLRVSNLILDKSERLTDHEWRVLRQHPAYTGLILSEVPGLGAVAEIAASHHERLRRQRLPPRPDAGRPLDLGSGARRRRCLRGAECGPALPAPSRAGPGPRHHAARRGLRPL